MAERKKKNPHDGHRERVREKFLRVGIDAFNEHELLEMVLYYSLSQGNTNELAHSLIDEFGSLKGVFSAEPSALCKIKGIGEKSAFLIHFIGQLVEKQSKEFDKRESMDSSDKFAECLFPHFKDSPTEKVIVLAMDEKLRLIKVIKSYDGRFDSVALPVAKITRELVNCGAYAAVLAHNHPGKVALPSTSDYNATVTVANAFSSVGIQLLDHIIVADDDYISMKETGKKYIFANEF